MIKNFLTNITYNIALRTYIFLLVIFLLLSYVNGNTEGSYLAILYIILLNILLYISEYFENKIRISGIRINYMNIYNEIPFDLKTEDAKINKKIYVKRVQQIYPCLKSPHEVLTYIGIHPETQLSKYFIKNFDNLNINFFRNKFIVILENENLAVCNPTSL